MMDWMPPRLFDYIAPTDSQLARDHRAQTPPKEKDDEYLRRVMDGSMARAQTMIQRVDWTMLQRAREDDAA